MTEDIQFAPGDPVQRVLVCGGRLFTDASACLNALAPLYRANPTLEIIQGGAQGADALARDFALTHGVPCRTFPAEWGLHGRAAGPIRNQLMIDEGKPDLVVAFPGGRGTADMIRRASRHGIPVVQVQPLSEGGEVNEL